MHLPRNVDGSRLDNLHLLSRGYSFPKEIKKKKKVDPQNEEKGRSTERPDDQAEWLRGASTLSLRPVCLQPFLC